MCQSLSGSLVRDENNVLVCPVTGPRLLKVVEGDLALPVPVRRIPVHDPPPPPVVPDREDVVTLIVDLAPEPDGGGAALDDRPRRGARVDRLVPRHAGEEIGVGEDEDGALGREVAEDLLEAGGALLDGHAVGGGAAEAGVDALAVLVEDAVVKGLVRVARVHAHRYRSVLELEIEPERKRNRIDRFRRSPVR